MLAIGGARVVSDHAQDFRGAFAAGAIVLGVAAGVAFHAFPEIDLIFASNFYLGDSAGFSGQKLGYVSALRSTFVAFFCASLALAILGAVVTLARRQSWFGLAGAQWLFLVVCLVVGPGLVANVALKEQWGRARPKHVVELGGDKVFTPPLTPSGECRHGCSFVSGEAASIFTPFYAAALVVPQWSVALTVAGTLGGLAAGMIRVSQGAHFLSDVIFAGVLMALTVVSVYRVMFGRSSIARPIAAALGLRRTSLWADLPRLNPRRSGRAGRPQTGASTDRF